MSDTTTEFTAGPATISAAKALQGTADKDLLALIKSLEADQQRAHLEAMGLAGLGKDVKKAARKAAYRLKSKGVEGDVAPEAAVEFKVEANLDEAILIGLPGLRGNYFAVAAELPGAQSFRLQLEGQHIEGALLEPVSPGRLKKIRRSMEEDNEGHAFLVANASLGVRTIDAYQAELEAIGAQLPDGWPHIQAWRADAVSHGADPQAVSARALLADRLGDISEELKSGAVTLLKDPRFGPPVPPDAPVDSLMESIGEAVHSKLELTYDQFEERLGGMAATVADAWLADARERGRLVAWLDYAADCYLAWGDEDKALQCLYVSDQVDGGDLLPSELDLVRTAFVSIMDVDAAWEHYQEFQENPEAHAHHMHGHHDHDDH